MKLVKGHNPGHVLRVAFQYALMVKIVPEWLAIAVGTQDVALKRLI